jgi:hypothetical protein
MRIAKSGLTRADLLVGLGIGVIALLLVGLILLKNNGARSVSPQRCPIDGLPAEWQTDGERVGSRRDHNICNYRHFSKIDQKPYTWWAA